MCVYCIKGYMCMYTYTNVCPFLLMHTTVGDRKCEKKSKNVLPPEGYSWHSHRPGGLRQFDAGKTSGAYTCIYVCQKFHVKQWCCPPRLSNSVVAVHRIWRTCLRLFLCLSVLDLLLTQCIHFVFMSIISAGPSHMRRRCTRNWIS